MNALINQAQDKIAELWQKSLAPRYEALNDSERRIVRIAAIAIPLIVFVFGIVLPVLDKNTALQHELQQTAKQVQEADMLADILAKQPKSQAGKSNKNILSQVDSIARQTHVRTFMTRLRPQPSMNGKQQLQTQNKNAPYKDVAAFIAALEKAGFTMSSLKIQAVNPGYVHMQATIGR